MDIETTILEIIEGLINSVLIDVEHTEPTFSDNDAEIDCLISKTKELSIVEDIEEVQNVEDIQEVQEVQEVQKLPVSPNKKLFEIISLNSYVKNCLSNKEKDINSLSYLIKQLLS